MSRSSLGEIRTFELILWTLSRPSGRMPGSAFPRVPVAAIRQEETTIGFAALCT